MQKERDIIEGVRAIQKGLERLDAGLDAFWDEENMKDAMGELLYILRAAHNKMRNVLRGVEGDLEEYAHGREETPRGEWLPIKNAPKDAGKIIDLWHKTSGRVTDLWWDAEDRNWAGLKDEDFTHFMIPLEPDKIRKLSNQKMHSTKNGERSSRYLKG